MYSIKDIQSLFLSYFSGCYDVAEEQEISKGRKQLIKTYKLLNFIIES